jgi:hypothetical protein
MWFSTPEMSDPWGVNRMMDTICVGDSSENTVFNVLSGYVASTLRPVTESI